MLDSRAVTNAGIRLVAEAGVQALSLRAVAGGLGVTPMALYRHVADSAALTDSVMAAVVDTCAAVTDTGDTSADLRDWAERFHRDLLGAPGTAGWLLTHWFECGPMLERIEALLAVVEHGGLTGFTAVAVTNAVFTYVLMRCEAEREVRSAGAAKRELRMAKARSSLPRLTALADHYTTAEFDAHFQFGLQALIDGMALPGGRSR